MIRELVIKNGTVIRYNEITKADIGITNGKITDIGTDLDGKEIIDADGLYVIPGGIDPHVHLEMPTGEVTSSDTWQTGTIAAALGGTTTVIDFIEALPDQKLIDALKERQAQAEHGCVIDYGLHMTIGDAKPETLAQIPEVIAAGIPSFKTYTTYGFKLSDEDLMEVLRTVGDNRGLVMIHAENDAIIEFCRKDLITNGKISPQYHPLSRPPAAEAEAVERVLALAETAHAPAYIVHVSTERGAQAIQRAIKRKQMVYGETCPQYLLLSAIEYDRPGFEAAKFVCSPPLRTEMDNAFLWTAIKDNALQTIGTDHCPFFFVGQKEIGKDLFIKIPGGIPGIEARMTLIHTFGVRSGKIDLMRWVEICSTNPAKIFGLYPRKGDLIPGSDADIVLFDPSVEGIISKASLHENVDYTPYEGFRYHGYPVMTMVRGVMIARNGQLIHPDFKGKFIFGMHDHF